MLNELLSMTIVQVLIGLLVWFVIGCTVLAAIDDKDTSLYKWASNAPLPLLYELTVMAWPIILLFWIRRKNNA